MEVVPGLMTSNRWLSPAESTMTKSTTTSRSAEVRTLLVLVNSSASHCFRFLDVVVVCFPYVFCRFGYAVMPHLCAVQHPAFPKRSFFQPPCPEPPHPKGQHGRGQQIQQGHHGQQPGAAPTESSDDPQIVGGTILAVAGPQQLSCRVGVPHLKVTKKTVETVT